MKIAHLALALTLLTALSAGLAPTGAAAQHAAPDQAGGIVLEGGFARAMLPGQPTGGGYLTIRNGGSTPDRLVGAASAAAGRVEIHEMSMEGDVMRMRQLADGLAIPAGATVELAPGGLHLMFFEVGTPFAEGASVPVTLTFEKAGKVDMALQVMAPNAGAGHHGMQADHGGHAAQ